MSAAVEASAKKLLERAIADEKQSKFQSALIRYQESIDLYLTVIKGCEDKAKKDHLTVKVKEYLDHAEKVKATVSKQIAAGSFHEQIQILEDSTHHSYMTVFRPYVDDMVTGVQIDDAYIRSYHQVCNLVRFCEMLVLRCPRLKTILLRTTADPRDPEQQRSSLATVRADLAETRRVALTVEYRSDLHDREIRLSTGWIVKIGRGLDYFKRVDKLRVGHFEHELRPCHATTVDVFHASHTRTT